MKKLPFLILAVIPLWLVAYPPIQDLPNHLGGVHVILSLLEGKGAFRGEYALSALPVPDLLATLTLLPLVAVFPAAVAGKILLSLAIVFTGLAADRFLAAAGVPEAGWLALPLALNWFVFMGFLSFLLAVPLVFLSLAFVLRHEDHFRRKERWKFTLLATLLYFAHLAAFAIVVGFVQIRRGLKRGWRAFLIPEPAFLPGVALWMVLALAEKRGAGWVSWAPLPGKLFGILDLWRWFAPGRDLLLGGAVVLSAALLVRQVRKKWLIASLAVFAIYLATPRGGLHGYWIDFRLLPFLFVFLLASFRFDARFTKWAGVAVLLLLTVRAGFETVRVGEPIAGMVEAAEALPRGARVIPLAERNDFGATAVWHHLVTWTVLSRDTITPYLFAKPYQQPLRALVRRYAPNEEWFEGYGDPPDLDRIAATWDFAWLTGHDPIEAEVERRGTLFVKEGSLRIYRFDHRK